MILTVVSYNVHECVGTDGRRDPERIAQMIQELKPDIVGLQEVDFSLLDGQKSHQLNYLAAATGLNAIAGPTIRRGDTEFGNALLTRPEIHMHQLHDVSFRRRQPRGVIDAVVTYEGKTIRILVTHLGLHARERKHQVEKLLEIVRAEQEIDCTILLGDMGSDPDGKKLIILAGVEVLKVGVCAFVIWRLRAHHRKFHAAESHEENFVAPLNTPSLKDLSNLPPRS